jgi:hypothetical protein
VITQGACGSFRKELTEGYHAFDSSYRAADTFKIALYSQSASLDPSTTTVYTATGEVTGTGYSAGGIALTVIAPVQFGVNAYLSFANAVWTGSVFTANGALIYNSTQGNRAVFILAFGGNKTPVNQVFTVQFPVNGPTTSVLRFGPQG